MNASFESSTTIKPYAAIPVKPYVTKAGNAYRLGVRREKKIRYEEAKSKTQALFVRRLNEVLRDRDLSDNALAKLIDPRKPTTIQSSISRVTACTQDPSLEMVDQIAKALDIPVTTLLSDETVSERTVPPPPPLSKGNKGTSSHKSGKNVNTARRNGFRESSE